jgi:hypothetical protein
MTAASLARTTTARRGQVKKLISVAVCAVVLAGCGAGHSDAYNDGHKFGVEGAKTHPGYRGHPEDSRAYCTGGASAMGIVDANEHVVVEGGQDWLDGCVDGLTS